MCSPTSRTCPRTSSGRSSTTAPGDDRGRRRELRDIPKHLADLADDPYRSLVAALIRRGGCAKSEKPFSEFLWADFLRRRIKAELVKRDFDAAIDKALEIARSDKAQSLPGWCGESSEAL